MNRLLNLSQHRVLCLAMLFVLITVIEAASGSTPPESYRHGPNDVVRIQVYGEEDLNVERKIDGDGNINFPLLGIVPVAGKTLQELQEYLTARLAGGYVRLPKVTAFVSKNRNFYLTGEVKTPGGYPYEEGLTVHRALAMAGGLTEKAERDQLRVLRHTAGYEQTLPVKLDTPVLPDDIIVVAEGQRFYISGEVKTPGRYLYERALTVHKALSLAGGRTEKGEKGTIKVTRVVEGLAQTVPVTPEAAVLPDDILVVELQDHKFYASGEVKMPGGYPYKEGLTVHRALAMAGGLTEKAERDQLRVLRHTAGHEQTLPVKLDTLVLPDDIIVVAEGQRFYISGEVKTPGRYLYERALTVHKALSLAGGRTEKGEKGTIKVTRVVEGLAQTVPVTPEAAVLPDDILVIEPQDHKFYASGEVKTPGGYPYKEGLTVHRALAMAGGLTEKAERDNLRVLRHTAGHQESVPVQLDTPVLPDDIIVVAEGKRFYISGEVKTPGRYLY
jgi:polysaccharide export outer membrane protein